MKPMMHTAAGSSLLLCRIVAAAAILLAFGGNLSAQEPAPEANPTGSASARASASSSPPPVAAEKKKDGETVGLNPSTGAVTFNGLSWNIVDTPALDLRYERFLMENQSLMKDEQEYYNKLQSLVALLTGNPFGLAGLQAPSLANFQKSFAVLKEIENRPDWRKFDGGISGQIATQIEALTVKMRASRDTTGVASKFEERRRNLENQLKFYTTVSDADPKRALVNAEKKAQLIAEKERLTVERAKYEAESVPAVAMAKAQFQVFIFTLLAQRRFQHVIVAGKLYQALIADGDLGMSQKNNPIAKEMKLDQDMPLTTISLSQAASAAHEDVRRSVEAYQNQVASSMLDAADRSLHYAFMLGEYMPEVRALPSTSKRQILDVRQSRKQMMSALNVRDYSTAETKLQALEKLAPDFDASETKMKILAAKMESDGYLLKAKNAVFSGDKVSAERALRQAVTIWPTNPALDDRDEIAGEFDEQMKLKKELDELIARSDYRTIRERAEKFAAAVHDDPARTQKLRDAGEAFAEIERAMGAYEGLMKKGLPYSAWEEIDAVASKYPKDEKLALAYQEAVVKASDYIGDVRQARLDESRGEDVTALSCYLAALSKNPDSESVKARVKSLSEKLLQDGLKGGTHEK